ncbi:MAG: hypothetical protein ACTSO9_17705 [Candidatus Helarchaeota archaeon]
MAVNLLIFFSFTGIIVWFILIGYLIYLTINTKLTYIDEFRRRFIIGLFSLLTAGALITISSYFTPLTYDITVILIPIPFVITLFLSNLLIILGLNKLNEYIYSLIGLEESKIKTKILFASIPIPLLLILVDFFLTQNFLKLLISLEFLSFHILYFYIAIYCFYLNHQMEGLNLKMMLYFGIAFSFEILNQVLLLFSPMLVDPIQTIIIPYPIPLLDPFAYNFLINMFSIGSVIFLILGFLDFKKMKTQSGT